MIGGMIGGRHGAMIGGLLGSIVGGRRLSRSMGNRGRSGGLGGLGGLGALIGGGDDDRAQEAPMGEPLSDHDAEILIKAMANAAKCDGQVDRAEVDAILGQVQNTSDAEMEFLNRELTSAFVPAADFAALVPTDLAPEAYVVSLAAVTVDTEAEERYLQDLATALDIDREDVEALHGQLGLTSR